MNSENFGELLFLAMSLIPARALTSLVGPAVKVGAEVVADVGAGAAAVVGVAVVVGVAGTL